MLNISIMIVGFDLIHVLTGLQLQLSALYCTSRAWNVLSLASGRLVFLLCMHAGLSIDKEDTPSEDQE